MTGTQTSRRIQEISNLKGFLVECLFVRKIASDCNSLQNPPPPPEKKKKKSLLSNLAVRLDPHLAQESEATDGDMYYEWK